MARHEALGTTELRAIEHRAQALSGWTEEATGLAAWVREDGARFYADTRAARELKQALGDVETLLAELKRLRGELDDALAAGADAKRVAHAPAPAPEKPRAAPPADFEDASAELGMLLSAPFHVTAKDASAAKDDPLVALAVQVAKALDPAAKELERARLLAMSFAASRGDMEGFWSARRMRTTQASAERKTRKK